MSTKGVLKKTLLYIPNPVMRTQTEKYPARYIIYAGPGHADAAREIPRSLYNLYRARHADTARQISRMLGFCTVSITVPVLEYITKP